MKALGYVNRYGYGIQRAQAALQENGNPPAEFQMDDKTFLAIIRRESDENLYTADVLHWRDCISTIIDYNLV